MTYQLLNGPGVIRTADGASIPDAPGNTDWKEYQAWLTAGNVPLPADPISTVPTSVSPLQARKALRQAGLIDQVNAAVAASTPDVQDAWQYASMINRTDPLVAALSVGLNLTPAALDNLFTLAATL